MDVSELQQKLKSFPGNAEVLVADWNEGRSNPTSLETLGYNSLRNEVILEDFEE